MCVVWIKTDVFQSHYLSHFLLLRLSESFNISNHIGVLPCHPRFYWHTSIWDESLPTSCLLTLAGPSSPSAAATQTAASVPIGPHRPQILRGSEYENKVELWHSCGFAQQRRAAVRSTIYAVGQTTSVCFSRLYECERQRERDLIHLKLAIVFRFRWGWAQKCVCSTDKYRKLPSEKS